MTTERSQSGFAFNPQDELNDLRMSDKALPGQTLETIH